MEILRNISIKNKTKQRLTIDELICLHEILTPEEICLGMPEKFLFIYKYIRKLNYQNKPDYERVINILSELKTIELDKLIKNNLNTNINHTNKEYKFCWEKIFFENIIEKNMFDNDIKEYLGLIKKKYSLNLENYAKNIFDIK